MSSSLLLAGPEPDILTSANPFDPSSPTQSLAGPETPPYDSSFFYPTELEPVMEEDEDEDTSIESCNRMARSLSPSPSPSRGELASRYSVPPPSLQTNEEETQELGINLELPASPPPSFSLSLEEGEGEINPFLDHNVNNVPNIGLHELPSHPSGVYIRLPRAMTAAEAQQFLQLSELPSTSSTGYSDSACSTTTAAYSTTATCGGCDEHEEVDRDRMSGWGEDADMRERRRRIRRLAMREEMGRRAREGRRYGVEIVEEGGVIGFRSIWRTIVVFFGWRPGTQRGERCL